MSHRFRNVLIAYSTTLVLVLVAGIVIYITYCVLWFLGSQGPSAIILAKCEYDVRRAYPAEQNLSVSAPMLNLMSLCMKTQGFEQTLEGEDCRIGGTFGGRSPYLNSACYEHSWWHSLNRDLYDFARRRAPRSN